LRDDFGKVDGLGAYRRELNDQITAEGSTPVAGQFVLTALGWALLWTVFLAAFPYSSRVRAAWKQPV
jgi:hypothetical protein